MEWGKKMLFNEIYGVYYKAVSEIIKEAVSNRLNNDVLIKIAQTSAFKESFIEILPALKNQDWKLIKSDFSTPIKHIPVMPLTTLQLRWLKSVSLDKRVKLFDLDFSFLDDTEPLFNPDDYIIFDRYCDGDNFENENYIRIFRTLLTAVNTNKKVWVDYFSSKGIHRHFKCDPYEIEYSEKDDKFRVKSNSCRAANTMNIGRITECKIIGDAYSVKRKNADYPYTYFIAELKDERNALERFLMNFSHFRKETEKISDNEYRIKVYFKQDYETEILIRVLSFGQFVKVTEPESFVKLIRERLIRQKRCQLK